MRVNWEGQQIYGEDCVGTKELVLLKEGIAHSLVYSNRCSGFGDLLFEC